MKRFVLVVLVLIFFVPVASVALAKTYDFNDYGISISFPTDMTVITAENAAEYSSMYDEYFKTRGILFVAEMPDFEPNGYTLIAVADYGSRYEAQSFSDITLPEIHDLLDGPPSSQNNTVVSRIWDDGVYDTGKCKFAKASIVTNQGFCSFYSTIQKKTRLSLTAFDDRASSAFTEQILDSVTIREKMLTDKAVAITIPFWIPLIILILLWGINMANGVSVGKQTDKYHPFFKRTVEAGNNIFFCVYGYAGVLVALNLWSWIAWVVIGVYGLFFLVGFIPFLIVIVTSFVDRPNAVELRVTASQFLECLSYATVICYALFGCILS